MKDPMEKLFSQMTEIFGPPGIPKSSFFSPVEKLAIEDTQEQREFWKRVDESFDPLLDPFEYE